MCYACMHILSATRGLVANTWLDIIEQAQPHFWKYRKERLLLLLLRQEISALLLLAILQRLTTITTTTATTQFYSH